MTGSTIQFRLCIGHMDLIFQIAGTHTRSQFFLFLSASIPLFAPAKIGKTRHKRTQRTNDGKKTLTVACLTKVQIAVNK